MWHTLLRLPSSLPTPPLSLQAPISSGRGNPIAVSLFNELGSWEAQASQLPFSLRSATSGETLMTHCFLQLTINPEAGEDGQAVLGTQVDFSVIPLDPRLDCHELAGFGPQTYQCCSISIISSSLASLSCSSMVEAASAASILASTSASLNLWRFQSEVECMRKRRAPLPPMEYSSPEPSWLNLPLCLPLPEE